MTSAALVLCLVAASGIHPAEGIKRHHRRHRRDPDPVGGEERVQEQNKYKPKFEDCETYDPTVEEGSRKGKDTEIDDSSFHLLQVYHQARRGSG